MRIFTGAALPSNADRVIVQENIDSDGMTARLIADTGAERFVRKQGSDFSAGQSLLSAGTRLDPIKLVAASAADQPFLSVFPRPRVAILATGDELAEPGSASEREGAMPDSVSTALASLIGLWHGEVSDQVLCPDDPQSIREAAGSLLETADVLVTIGGASVGERDFADAALPAGFQTLFEKVALKPGKPINAAHASGRTWIFGLPGNPTSAMVGARVMLLPLLTVLGGGDFDDALMWEQAILTAPLPPTGKRETLYRAKRSRNGVAPLQRQVSSDQLALSQTDFLVRRPAGAGPMKIGDAVTGLMY